MATNVTLISNTLVNKYLTHDGGNVAIHDFPTQNARELLFASLSLITRQERERVHEALRWQGRHSAEVNENINLGYSHDQGYS